MPDTKSPSRIVILGASNLSLGWPKLIRQLNTSLAAPFDIYTAHGMGRSYCGERSGFVFWQLPGILTSGIWSALDTIQDTNPSCAIITDLGNDLVYGKTPEQVTDAAQECVLRLREWNPNCRIVMTRPPVESVSKVGWFRFLICRLILFPKCPLNLTEAKAATLNLAERIENLAQELNVEFFQPPAKWYGLDPIHLKRKHQSTAFSQMIAAWHLNDLLSSSAGADADVRTAASRPKSESGWVFGRRRTVKQPSVSTDRINVFAY